MKLRIDRSATALAAAILLAYSTVSDAQDRTNGATSRAADRPAAQAQQPATAAQVRDARMSDLIGMDVRNAKGENLGDVRDLVVDMESGRVAYAVVGIGGFLGIGEKLSAFPMSAFKVSQAAPRTAATGRTTTDKSPGNPFDNDGVPGDKGPIGSDRTASTERTTTDKSPRNPMDNDGVRGDKGPIGSDRTASAGRTTTDKSPGNPLDNDGVRGDKGPAGSDRTTAGTNGTANTRLSGRGMGGMHLVLDADPDRLKRAPNFDRNQWPDWNDAKVRGDVDKAYGNTAHAGKAGRMLRASQLLDADIQDAQQKNVGEIEDLVVDVRSGQVRYAVIDFDQAWTPNDKLVAMPMKSLKASGERKELVFMGSKDQLANAPSFDKGKWPDLNVGAFRTSYDRYSSSWRPAGDATMARDRATTPGTSMTNAPTDRSRGSTASNAGAAGGGTTDPARTGTNGATTGTSR
jgi:sporulation protein YlmC with PRC-barrel domain